MRSLALPDSRTQLEALPLMVVRAGESGPSQLLRARRRALHPGTSLTSVVNAMLGSAKREAGMKRRSSVAEWQRACPPSSVTRRTATADALTHDFLLLRGRRLALNRLLSTISTAGRGGF